LRGAARHDRPSHRGHSFATRSPLVRHPAGLQDSRPSAQIKALPRSLPALKLQHPPYICSRSAPPWISSMTRLFSHGFSRRRRPSKSSAVHTRPSHRRLWAPVRSLLPSNTVSHSIQSSKTSQRLVHRGPNRMLRLPAPLRVGGPFVTCATGCNRGACRQPAMQLQALLPRH